MQAVARVKNAVVCIYCFNIKRIMAIGIPDIIFVTRCLLKIEICSFLYIAY